MKIIPWGLLFLHVTLIGLGCWFFSTGHQGVGLFNIVVNAVMLPFAVKNLVEA